MGEFSLAARHLECQGCGAPLASASPGARVRCQFCGAEYAIERRSADGRGALSAAEDIARLSRLRGQLEHPIDGHIYDLDGVPAGASARGVSSASDLSALDRLWGQLKPRAIAGQDSAVDQHALCWCAIRSAELRIGSDAAAARIKLETSLDLLRDPGHRHLIRCALAEAAIDVGELDAAEGWLAECDQAAEVLELDTAYRHARLRVALARDHVGDALALIGQSKDAIPVAADYALRFEVARVHLDERAGHAQQALERLRAAQEEHGAHTLDWARRLGLAPVSTHQLEQEQLAEACLKAQAELAELTDTRRQLASGLFAGPFYALLLTVPLSIVGCATEKGPLLGLTTKVVCPATCERCEGPYAMQFWSSSSSGNKHVVLCQTPEQSTESWTPFERMDAKRYKHPQVVPGGTWTLWGLTYLWLLPFAIVGAWVRARVRGAREGEKVQALRDEIERLQAQLDVPMEAAKTTLGPLLVVLAIVSFVPVMLVVINLLIR